MDKKDKLSDRNYMGVSKHLEFDAFVKEVQLMILPTGINIIGIVENARYAKSILPERVTTESFIDSVNRQLRMQGNKYKIIEKGNDVFLVKL